MNFLSFMVLCCVVLALLLKRHNKHIDKEHIEHLSFYDYVAYEGTLILVGLFFLLALSSCPYFGSKYIIEAVDSIYVVGDTYLVTCGDKEYMFDIKDINYKEEAELEDDGEPYVSSATEVGFWFIREKVDGVFRELHMSKEIYQNLKDESKLLYSK